MGARVIAGSAELGSSVIIPMRTLPLIALALSTALAGPARAQYRPATPTVQPFSTADQLAAVMRRVAAAPRDVFALVSAGELSIKLDDMSAAAAFFARAEKVDPRNGRVKAGMAAILVRAERPGEALRYFQMAESFGHPADRYASDRGLAHDLLGEQERAQRDYRLALRTTADDETVRRYALSLGISGRRALALEQLDPLTRRQDRAAWRVRAFVLAMDGDVAGAATIATTMMPRGMALGLQPFFERLPSLPAADRAFAVHFGEVRPTPARLADLRMKPGLAPLGPDPFAPVQVAVVRPATPPVALASKREPARGRTRAERRATSAGPRTPDPRAIASVERRREPVTVSAARPNAIGPAPAAPAPIRSIVPAPVQVASATPLARPTVTAPGPAVAVPVPSVPAQLAGTLPSITPAPIRAVASTSTPVEPTSPAAAPEVAASGSTRPVPPSAGSIADRPVQVALARPTVIRTPASNDAAAPTTTGPGFSSVSPTPALTAAAVPAPVDVAAAPTLASPTAVRSEESILARIVASMAIPGEELGIVQPERRPSATAAIEPATARVLAAGEAQVASQNADRAAAARTIAATKPVGAKPTARKARAVTAEPVAEARAGSRPARGGRTELAEKEDAQPRAAAAKRLADRKKAADEKVEPTKAKGKRELEAQRIWVQVAGGASEGDLPRAWSAAQKKATALKGRVAYTTPLRATNRVVTGPFKTDAEARAFVNQLARQGVSAFQFTSATGQKMTKLPVK